jgi:hypothetical protein
MVFSKKEFFEIKLTDDNNKEYKEYNPKEKNIKPYIIGENGKDFMIKMIVNSAKCDDKKFYGSKLYIDGEEVLGIKTFKRSGRYFGFKCGSGIYKKFRFGTPKYDSNDVGGNREIGKIRIIFYNTQSFNTGKNTRIAPHQYKARKSTYLDANKKLCFKSLQVYEGDEFDNGHTTRQRIKNYSRDNKVTNIIDFQDDIDDAEFSYSDFYGLIAMGMISTNNLNDLKYLPTITLDYKALGNALLTIVERKKDTNNRMSLQSLNQQFNLICEHELSLYYSNQLYSSLQNMIKSCFSNKFIIIDDEFIEPVNSSIKNSINEKLNQDSNLLTSEYVLTGNQALLCKSRILDRKNNTNDSVLTNNCNKMILEKDNIIDLTTGEITELTFS